MSSALDDPVSVAKAWRCCRSPEDTAAFPRPIAVQNSAVDREAFAEAFRDKVENAGSPAIAERAIGSREIACFSMYKTIPLTC